MSEYKIVNMGSRQCVVQQHGVSIHLGRLTRDDAAELVARKMVLQAINGRMDDLRNELDERMPDLSIAEAGLIRSHINSFLLSCEKAVTSPKRRAEHYTDSQQKH
jgi:hypothetical protein